LFDVYIDEVIAENTVIADEFENIIDMMRT
jgi:hypothetical protein